MKKFRFYFCLFICIVFGCQVQAQTERLIRDTEVENTIRMFMKPLLYKAHLVREENELERLEVYVLQTDDVNAFTFGGLTLVVTTGLLMRMGPEAAMGVFAHETGHMVSKHVLGRHEEIQNAMRSSLLGLIVGIGAGVFNPAAGAAILQGSMEATKRNYLSYSRAQEASADQSALRLLEANQFSAKGLEETFKYFQKKAFLPDYAKIEYLLTHPMPENRLQYIQHHLSHSKHTNTDLPEKYRQAYRRVQAKISAFTNPQQALRDYREDQTIAGRYAKAIAYMELGKSDAFSAEMQQLDQMVPNDPFFREIRAQAAFEYGHMAESIKLYEQVHQQLPKAPLIDVALAHALIEANRSQADNQKALILLKKANQVDPTPFAWHLIAIASGRLGDEGQAAYALAEKAILLGDKQAATYQIKRALQKLDKNSPFYRRATDIQIAIEYL